MKYFIEVTAATGEKMSINVNLIINFRTYKSGALIVMINENDSLEVTETYEQIKEKINRA